MRADSGTILPLTQDVDVMEAAVLERLDVVSKRVERLTGFAVRRNDPAAADFLMTMFASQLAYNDFEARARMVHDARMAEMKAYAKAHETHLLGVLERVANALSTLTDAQGDLRGARADLQSTARQVAALLLQQLTSQTDDQGNMTLLAVTDRVIASMEARARKADEATVDMFDEAASGAARKAETKAIEAIGTQVQIQLQVHGATAVQGLNSVAARAEKAVTTLEQSTQRVTSDIMKALNPEASHSGFRRGLRKSWLWVDHTIGVPTVATLAVVGAGLFALLH